MFIESSLMYSLASCILTHLLSNLIMHVHRLDVLVPFLFFGRQFCSCIPSCKVDLFIVGLLIAQFCKNSVN